MAGAKLPTDRGAAQDARALISLCDEIVHYKTDWRSSPVVSKKLEALLRARISLNPYACGNVVFPEQCVSAGSARWAVGTARKFMLDFAGKAGFRSTV